MSANILPSTRATIMGAIDPVSLAPGPITSDWVDASKFENLLATVQVGVLGGGATVDAKLQQATSSVGAGAKDITGKAITQLTKAHSDDNKQVALNLRTVDLDSTNGFTFAALVITVGGAASLISGIIQGVDADHEPETALTSVNEVI